MKKNENISLPAKKTTIRSVAGVAIGMFISLFSYAQGVTEIITNYNGYWKSSSTAISPVKPDNRHNLLSFMYNGTRYSTGVNDALLSANGQTFSTGNFLALPLQNVNGTVNSNTKIGLGAMVDGVHNGAGPAPSRTLAPYLNDGTNGLDMGTCVANLPSGTMFMSVSNIQAANIGDGIPDILVTQIADPSSSHDKYEFTDVNGVSIGNPLDIVLNNISPLGNWVADFYEATGTTVLGLNFTQTQRAIRLWAADFSAFGLNASNVQNIAYFKITLSGDSDIAFVAYNTTTITVQQVLDMNSAASTRLTRPAIAPETTELSVFPNPASGSVKIGHPKSVTGDKISLYNNNGMLMSQVVPSINGTSTAMNLTGMASGNYYIVLTTGFTKQTKKLIIR